MIHSKPFEILYRHRTLLWQTVKSDIKMRFAGSTMGILWLIFYPLLMLGAYAAVYIFIFKVKFHLFNSNEYVALIFCGLIPFLGFSEALGMGVGSVVTNANLIKNTLFPIELVPVKAVLTAQCTQVVGMFLLLIVLILMGRWSVWWPLFILIWIFQILFSIGLIWILSSINVFFRDLQNIIPVIILILMMVSPIAYTEDMIPSGLRYLMALNPLYYLIISYQKVLMLGELPDLSMLAILCFISIFTFMFGYWFFSRMKGVFADNV